MWPHHPVPRLFIADAARYNNISPVYPYPHITPRHEECLAVVAVLPPEVRINPDALAHRDFPRKLDIPVTESGVYVEYSPSLGEKDENAFPCDLLCCRVLRLLSQRISPVPVVPVNWSPEVKKRLPLLLKDLLP